jgi:hypothetical protein
MLEYDMKLEFWRNVSNHFIKFIAPLLFLEEKWRYAYALLGTNRIPVCDVDIDVTYTCITA